MKKKLNYKKTKRKNKWIDQNNIFKNEINQLKNINIDLKSEKDENSNQANLKQKKILEQLKEEKILDLEKKHRKWKKSFDKLYIFCKMTFKYF